MFCSLKLCNISVVPIQTSAATFQEMFCSINNVNIHCLLFHRFFSENIWRLLHEVFTGRCPFCRQCTEWQETLCFHNTRKLLIIKLSRHERHVTKHWQQTSASAQNYTFWKKVMFSSVSNIGTTGPTTMTGCHTQITAALTNCRILICSSLCYIISMLCVFLH